MFDHEKYVSDNQKLLIESIPQHNRWGGYKNVRFNLQIWESFWTQIYNGKKDDVILDYGCGAAWSHVVGKKLGFTDLKGIDINTEEVIKQFSQWHKILGNEIDLWDGKTMPYDDNKFDAVVAKASITKLCNSDWERFYSEMNRVSKQDCKWYIAPDYMFERMPDKEKRLKEKNIQIIVWDWDRTHPCNDVFQPNLANV